jgi:hypothetical protein
MSSLICKNLKNMTLNPNIQNIHYGSSTYIYNKLTNANINYLKSKSGGKCVIRVNFSRMQRFLYQVSNTNNTLNVLLTPCVSSVVVHFG